MSVFICDFELVDHDNDGTYVVYPVGLPGATEGYGLKDAGEIAADWLRETALGYLMTGDEWPDLPLGTDSTRGGRMVTLVADVSLDQVPAMTAAEAARTLGVSTARVAQLCKVGYLESWNSPLLCIRCRHGRSFRELLRLVPPDGIYGQSRYYRGDEHHDEERCEIHACLLVGVR